MQGSISHCTAHLAPSSMWALSSNTVAIITIPHNRAITGTLQGEWAGPSPVGELSAEECYVVLTWSCRRKSILEKEAMSMVIYTNLSKQNIRHDLWSDSWWYANWLYESSPNQFQLADLLL